MRFSVTSDTPEIALATGDAVIALGREELDARQSEVGIPSVSQIGLDVLQSPEVGDVVLDGKMRNMAIVGLLGAGLSLIAAVLFDDIVGLFRRWRSRRRDRRAAGPQRRSAKRAGDVAETVGDAEHPSFEQRSGPEVEDLGTQDRRRARRDLAQARRDA